MQALSITCRVNGKLRQNSNTSLMIQPVINAIVELSQGMTLEAGTVIATGTPGGVALGMKPPVYLKSGDVVECEIEGIGKKRKKQLFEKFGSAENIAKATIDEIKEIEGFGDKHATAVYEYFKNRK